MATLKSEEKQIPSFIRFDLTGEVREEGRWLSYRLTISSGGKELLLEDQADEVGRCWLSLEPFDEVKRLIEGLEAFLRGGKTFSFEPQEPNFEILLSREELGFSVYCFIDSGNALHDHATWDGLGLRMFSSKEHLEAFLAELKAETRIFSAVTER
ncbi:MAG TPA: hypothetical protein V6C82_04415 [Chroococcales cyanobacterium]|jgi:hypothetical protein